jgi:hypothetical protein
MQFLAGGVLDKVLSHLETKEKYRNSSDARKADIVKKVVESEIDRRRQVASVVKTQTSFFSFRVIMFMFMFPLAFYWNAILIDSIFDFEWSVLALPEKMNEWAGFMLASYFIASPVDKFVDHYIRKNK